MRWVVPTEKDTANQTPEKRLWAVAVRSARFVAEHRSHASSVILIIGVEKIDERLKRRLSERVKRIDERRGVNPAQETMASKPVP